MQKFEAACNQLKQGSETARPYADLAKVYMYEARVTGEHPYYFPAAIDALDHGLKSNDGDLELLMLKTSVLLSLHQFAEARELAIDLCAKMPRVAPVFGMLCDANVELGNYEEAVRAADSMISIRPGLESYARVSHLREIYGDMQGALDAMKMAVQAGLPGTEDAAWTRTTYGNLLINAGRMGEAEQQFHIARMERLNYPFALAGIARIRHAQKNYDAAMRILDSAFAKVPEVSFVEEMAEIEAERGNRAEVIKLLARIETMLDEDEAAGHANHGDRALIYAKHNYKLSETKQHHSAVHPCLYIDAQWTSSKRKGIHHQGAAFEHCQPRYPCLCHPHCSE